MQTILPKKAVTENPIATDDVTFQQLVMDPNVPQFRTSNAVTSNSQNVMGPAFTQNIGQQIYQPPQQINYTAAGDNAGQNADVLVKNDNNDWINKKWRPAMGWMYMTICIFDFIIFPIMFTVVQFWEVQAHNDAFRQWQPLTLSGAGLFHMAMGAVLGIAAYGRTKEKLEGKT